ncbi:FAD-dependent monooxygenase [Streptomyces sp. NPDC004284]|uniref:FAD-dependent monooxygenase n=1 Tax=Streptomyces sp. NPDC004284 TaxID=3364695 RepID=UPI0036A7EF35
MKDNAAAETVPPKPVLVVGAGPVGLAVTTDLARRGVPVRCVDRAAERSPLTKALGVWPRSVEILDKLGARGAAPTRGLRVDSFRYYSGNRPVARLRFPDRTAPLILPQPDVEAILGDCLDTTDARVERGVQLLDLDQDEQGVKARLRDARGDETVEEFSWVIGCDGAGSTVRNLTGIAFEGATYPHTFVVADVDLEGDLEHEDNHYYCSPRGILVIAGLPDGQYRVFTSAPPGLDPAEVTLDVVQRLVDERGPGGLRLVHENWISAFSVHARHAETTRSGRILLAGDAAHIHSPAGGQGLNTGLYDAHNLAWKLALVWHGDADAALLDTYVHERGAAAQDVVRQADRQTRAWLLQKPHQVLLRDLALRAGSALRLAHWSYTSTLAGFRTVHATAERPGTGRGGFRSGALLPDRTVRDGATGRRTTLRRALPDLTHTVLVLDPPHEAAPRLRAELQALRTRFGDRLTVRVLDTSRRVLAAPGDWPRPARPGLPRRPLLVLVRPDHHIDAVRPLSGTAGLGDRLATVLSRRGGTRTPAPTGA